MATIREHRKKDGTRSYNVQVRVRGHAPESATFRTRTQAKRWGQKVEAALRENRYQSDHEAKRHTLANLIDRYSAEYLPAKRDSKSNAQRLGYWREKIGDLVLADVTAPVIIELRDELRSEVARATVNRYLAALSHCLTVAVNEYRWLRANPMKTVSRLDEPRGRVRFLSDDERGRLLGACKASAHPQLYPVVVLALSTGARQGEIMNLRWAQVDLGRGVARLEQTKNDERRALPLAGEALHVLRELSKVRRIDTDLVFPRRDGKAPTYLRKPWLKALQDAEIDDFRFHDLRHSAASYLAMSGATLAEIAAVLGHKTLSMVKRYSHLSDPHTAGVVARMNAKFLGGPGS